MSFFASILSGLLLTLTLHYPSMSWLACLALVPFLIVLLRGGVPFKYALLFGWLAGLIGYGFHFSYVATALDMDVFIAALIYYALYVGVFAVGVTFCSRQSIEYGSLVAPCLWTGLEYIRAHVLTGVQIGTLGATQAETLPVVQIISVTGIFGLSFILVFINVAVTRLILLRRAGTPMSTFGWAGAATLMIVGVLSYGGLSLWTPEPEASDILTIATVQGDIDERGMDQDVIRQQIFDRYRTLTVKLTAIQPDLIVYPETMTGSYLMQDSLFLSFLANMGEQTGSRFLVGSRYLVRTEDTYGLYNSVFLVDSTGHILDRYDKNKLAPFGEYTPLGAWLPWLAEYRIAQAELTPGEEWAPLAVTEKALTGIGICYEAMFSADIRHVIRQNTRLLSIISDDFWFQGTPESRTFFNEGVLRAIENRTPMVRCANMGRSGIVDAYGRIISTPLPGAPGVTYGTVRLRTTISIYTQMGDVLPWLSLIVCILVIAWCVFRRTSASNTA
jgi:apolipoprotein N-acyltransferase